MLFTSARVREQNQRVRYGIDLVFLRMTKHRRRGGQVSPGGKSISCNPPGIDVKIAGMPSNPANEVPHIRHGFKRRDVLLIRQPVFACHGNYALPRKSLRIVVHPFRTADVPAAIVQQDDGRARFRPC
jgi:hypothetical protein